MPVINKIAFISLLIFTLFFLTGCSKKDTLKPFARKGVIDLSTYNFDDKGNAELDGEWEFFPGKIITPKEFEKYSAFKAGDSTTQKKLLKTFYINQPTNWKNKDFGFGKLDPYGVATYRLKVIINKNYLADSAINKIFGLKIIEIHSAYKLWINGVLFHEQGNVTTTEDNFRTSIKPYAGYFIPASDTITIVINASNFFDRKMAGMDDRVLLGSEKDIAEDTNYKIFFFIFSSGILLIMSIYNFLLFFIRREEKLHYYLGIISFLFAVQSIFEGEKAIYFLFPSMNSSAYMCIWMLTLNIFSFLIFFYQKLFPEESNKLYAYIALCTTLLFSFVAIVTPYSVYGHVLDYVLYLGLLIMAYILVILIKAYKMNRKFSGLTLIGFFIPVVFGINDIFFGLDWIVTGYYSPIGFVILIVILSFVTSSKFAKSYDRVIELSNDLKALNENLERAVEERTEELKTANSELSILNRQKDRFFSIISHDLKNPFNTLLGITDYLRTEKVKDEKELSELYDTLYDSAVKGHNLLDNLLEWSAIQFSSVKPKPVNTCINDILMEITEHFEKQLLNKQLVLNVNAGKSISVLCDPDTVRTIFRNLVGNAIKFSYPGGNITVSAIEEDHHIKIKVKDCGIGIPAEKQDHIFKIDTKYHREGTSGETGSGMGLIIIKELIERNGGEIYFTSQVQKGTEFIIFLPKVN